MMAELDEKYYSLKNQKTSNENQQRNVQSQIDSIDGKIERLKSAYSTVDSAKESIKDIRKANKKLQDSYKNSWKGTNANSIFGACMSGGVLYGNYDSYIKRIDEVEDEINWEICRLKDQRAEKYGVLQGLVRTWNSISTQIRNYFN